MFFTFKFILTEDKMSTRQYVIIGTGIAGVTAASTIREIDKDSKITLIGRERYLPYSRYLLTDFLCGTVDSGELFYTPAEYFTEKNILLRKGQNVTSIDTNTKKVILFNNEEIPYDKLLIATGGKPRPNPVLKPYLPLIHKYYSLKDVLHIKKRIKDIEHFVVAGEGLSTLDLLRGLINLNKKVSYIIKGEKVQIPLLEDEVRNEFNCELHEFLEKKGINVITDDRIVSLNSESNKIKVLTLQQKQITTDIVFVFDYYQPDLYCVKNTEIETKLGILVDTQLRTSVDDIFAAGDCVEIYHPIIKDYWINFGWPNALTQGFIAGKNMTGHSEEYKIKDTLVFNLMGKSLKARWWE